MLRLAESSKCRYVPRARAVTRVAFEVGQVVFQRSWVRRLSVRGRDERDAGLGEGVLRNRRWIRCHTSEWFRVLRATTSETVTKFRATQSASRRVAIGSDVGSAEERLQQCSGAGPTNQSEARLSAYRYASEQPRAQILLYLLTSPF
ncbi:hypothetical protein HRbin30_00235 [bacterium HR30]|nr:hypothetical protein HRbin30_00235 [bacterium HR30]